MVKTENFIQVAISSQDQLRDWLLKNHNQKESVWLVTYKKVVEDKYVSAQQVLDELLCFGWIDGIRRVLNDTQTMQLISPRKVEYWTKSYKDRYATLLSKNLVMPAGKESVAKSKEAGLWEFMDDVDAIIKPDDFLQCLESFPNALANFNAFNASSQRFILRWIKISKTPKTRTERIIKAATLANDNKKIPGL